MSSARPSVTFGVGGDKISGSGKVAAAKPEAGTATGTGTVGSLEGGEGALGNDNNNNNNNNKGTDGTLASYSSGVGSSDSKSRNNNNLNSKTVLLTGAFVIPW